MELLLSIYSILFGLIFGSFLNVCIYRLPENKSIGGRSACPNCKKKISWVENIPVASFIFLKGRCSSCGQKISLQYPLVEILTALLSLATLVHVRFNLVEYGLWFLILICPLIVLAVIDLQHQILPDRITLPGIGAGIGLNLYPYWPLWQEGLLFSLKGILLGGGFLYLLGLAYMVIRKKEGMGGGDVKLAAGLGAFFGWQAMVLIFFSSSVLALLFAGVSRLFSKKVEIIPYGPFLAIGALIYFFVFLTP